MKRTALLAVAAFAGLTVAAAAQTSEPADDANPARVESQDRDQERVQAREQERSELQEQERAEVRTRERAEVRNQEREDAEPAPRGPRYVDADGDGICDNLQAQARGGRGQGRRAGKGRRGNGPGDGTGNQGVGPRDGSGFGPGAQSGNCDGTGPKGKGRRGQ
jgi:hypothetical protein